MYRPLWLFRNGNEFHPRPVAMDSTGNQAAENKQQSSGEGLQSEN